MNLEACPFCGSEEAVLHAPHPWAYEIRCQKCKASGPGWSTPEQAAEAWNTRPEVRPKRWVWDGDELPIRGTCGPFMATIEFCEDRNRITLDVVRSPGRDQIFVLCTDIEDAKKNAQNFINIKFWETAEGGKP